MLSSVNASDPTMILQALGHPAEHPKAGSVLDDLRDGDYAVIMDGDARIFGAIYFMRPRQEGCVPDTYLDGEVLGVDMLLAPPHRTLGQKFLRQHAERKGFELVRHEGRDMDGVTQPFFVLKSK